MTGSLDKLKQNRDALLLAEVAAWLHDIGKFCSLHIERHSIGGTRKWSNKHAYKVVADNPLEEIHLSKTSTTVKKGETLNNLLKASSPKAADFLSTTVKNYLKESKITLLGETYSLAEFIMLGIPGFSINVNRSQLLDGKPGWIPAVLGVCHSEAHIDKQYPAEGEGGQTWPDVFISNAFGFEVRKVIVDSSPESLDRRLQNLPVPPRRKDLFREFAHGLGDTRRPINEVTLGDWAWTVAALLKPAVAGAIIICQQQDIRQRQKDKTIDHDLRWRLLRVTFDFLGLYAKALKIADLLGYQERVEQTYAEIKQLVEGEYPLGNEVYRDTTGIYFTFPDIHLPAELARDIRRLIEEIEPEIAPRIGVTAGDGNTAAEQLKRILAKARWEAQNELAQPLDQQNLNPCWQQLWENLPWGKWEVCPVCRLRPKKEEEEVCEHCQNRRQSRIQKWKENPAQTIWMDEIADQYGRLALIVGKFGLDDWLSGDLVQTMLVKAVGNDPDACVAKNPSPARLRRVWDTCQQFWIETVQNDILSNHSCTANNRTQTLHCVRLSIIPDRTGWCENIPYDGVLDGRPISLLWDKKGGHFITIINLELTAGDSDSVSELIQKWKGRQVEGREPDSPRKRWSFIIQDVKEIQGNLGKYSPFLSLLTSPDQFLAFVPASKSLKIVQHIHREYKKQFGKVQNRLPLFLGLVFFERKKPLMPVMDSARCMIKQVSLSEERWTVECSCPSEDMPNHHHLHLSKGKQRISFDVPLKMGDLHTDDIWYPYFFVEQFADSTTDHRPYRFQQNGRWLIHAKDLREDDVVSVTPSRFSYLFLESTAQRFRFDPDQDVMLLDQLERLTKMWRAICKPDMTDTKLQAIHALFEGKRQEWKLGEPNLEYPITDQAFYHLVEATLKQNNLQDVVLVEDVLNGCFHRCVDLYLHVLKRRISDEQKEEEQNEPATV